MTVRHDMASFYGTFSAGDTILAEWANSINDTLDDKVSQTNDTNQAMASNLIFASSKFPQMVSNPSVDNDATRKSYVDGAITSAGHTLWNSDNSPAVTRYVSIDIVNLENGVHINGGAQRWTYSNGSGWASLAGGPSTMMDIPYLPHGAKLKFIKVTGQYTSGSDLFVQIIKRVHSTGAWTAIATVYMIDSMQENSESLGDEVVDNDTNSYLLYFGGASDARIRAIQIDYTVVRPQP